jgi:hypothetical protein
VWISTSDGMAFAPDDLAHDVVNHLPDTRFPELFEAIDQLSQIIESQEAPSMFSRLLLRREAQTFGSRISGSNRQFPIHVTNPFIPFHVFDSLEALSYAQAAQYAWTARAKPYTARYLRAVHKRLLPRQTFAGSFRSRLVGMGPRGCALADAAVLLTPSDMIEGCLNKLASFANSVPSTHRLASLAMMHFQIIAIHPFIDGNGRVARAVLPAQLRYFGLIDSPLLFVSESLLRNAAEYFRRVESLQKYNELTAWVRFFVEVLIRQAQGSVRFIQIAAHVRAQLIGIIVGAGIPSAPAMEFAEDMMLSPTFCVSRARGLLKLSKKQTLTLLDKFLARYGLTKVALGEDPLYQFGDIADVLLL